MAVAAVGRLPLWPPLTYALLAAVLVAVVHLVAMIDGSLPWGALSLPLVGFAVWPAYVLAAKAYVRSTAGRAVDDLCPALTCDAGEVERVRYRLTTQPMAASAALAVLGMQYVFVGANPEVLGSQAVVAQLVAWQALAVVLFVAPLWNAHRRLARAKATLGREVGVRFERTVRALHEALDEGRSADAATLKDALAGLETARQAVARASTWPWEAEAPRLLVSALLLPLLAWAVQQALGRVFG